MPPSGDDMMDEFARFQAELSALEGETTTKEAPTPSVPAPAPSVPARANAAAPAPVRANARVTIAREAERVPAGPAMRAPPPPPTMGTATHAAAAASGRKDFKPVGKALARAAGGERWEDSSLAEWPENDYRIFVGDLGNECTDEMLSRAFAKYPSFAKAKVVKDKANPGKNKGYGFASFLDVADYSAAMKEMNGKFIGNRPVKLRKSSWDERTDSSRQAKGLGSKKPKPLHKRKHIAIGPSLQR